MFKVDVCAEVRASDEETLERWWGVVELPAPPVNGLEISIGPKRVVHVESVTYYVQKREYGVFGRWGSDADLYKLEEQGWSKGNTPPEFLGA